MKITANVPAACCSCNDLKINTTKIMEIRKIKHDENLEWLKTMSAENAQYLQFIQNDVISRLFNQLGDLLIQGLKNKGFEFENVAQLEFFIRTRCRKEDHIEFKKHIYYVDEIPFFMHYYEVVFEPITEYNNGIKMTANYGKYAFL